MHPSDTGDPGDGITQDSTPTISGTGGTPGEIISLYDGNGTSPVGVAVVGGDGKWSVTPAAPLSGGVHSLTVTTTDMGGNESGRSQPLSVTVDTAKPTLVTAETTLDGTRVVLTFNETLSATTAAVSGFAVQSGTGSILEPQCGDGGPDFRESGDPYPDHFHRQRSVRDRGLHRSDRPG